MNFWSIVPDTVEYGELRSGVRAEAFIFGFVTLVQKVALGLSSAFLGLYLGWIGYVANQTQSAETIAGLKLLVTLVAGLGPRRLVCRHVFLQAGRRPTRADRPGERNAKERSPK